MAYSTSNPPQLASTGIAGTGNIWVYKSTDAAATVDADGYITDAKALGMKVGDLVIVHDTDATPYTTSLHSVSEINADGSANLTNAGATQGTDGD